MSDSLAPVSSLRKLFKNKSATRNLLNVLRRRRAEEALLKESSSGLRNNTTMKRASKFERNEFTMRRLQKELQGLERKSRLNANERKRRNTLRNVITSMLLPNR